MDLRLGNQGLATLMGALDSKSPLQVLNLSGNDITNIESVLQFLNSSRTFKEMNLNNNPIGDNGLNCLAQ